MGLKFSKIEGEHSIQDDAAAVNPNLKDGVGYQLNCGNCTIAYELRRQGFNVEAASRVLMSVDEWERAFDGFEAHRQIGRVASVVVDDITKEALAWGEGARGMVFGEWKTTGGHFFSFEVLGGNVNFIDSQDPSQNAGLFFNRMKPLSIVYGRTDNLKLNDGAKSAVIDKGSKL